MTRTPTAASPALSLLLACLLAWPPLTSADIIVMDTNATLRHYLCDEEGGNLQDNTTIQLNPGVYVLEEGPMCRIENLTDLTIRGSGDEVEPTVIVCQGDNGLFRGIAFANVTNFHIEEVRLESCGTEIPTDLPELTYDTFTFFGPGQKAVLLFSHCLDLCLDGVTIDHSFGTGIVGINVMGTVELNRVSVLNTDNYQHPLCDGAVQDLSCSGSGVAFVYSDNNFTAALGENASLSIVGSLFVNNTNRIPLSYFLPLYFSVRQAFQSDPVLFTGAAGVSVHSSQKNFFLDFDLKSSTIENCGGQVGGLVLFNYNTVMRTRYYVWNSNFIHNKIVGLDGSGIGGGLVLIFAIYLDHLGQFPDYPDSDYTVMLVDGSYFYGNLADSGGAIFLHVTPQNISEFTVVIQNTSFTKNVANIGSAIVGASISTSFVPKLATVVLEDVEAFGNFFPDALLTGADTVENSAVFVFANIRNVTVTGKYDHGSKFYSNSPGVFITAGGDMFLRGHVKFEDNYGFNGGALSLYDNSKLFIHEGSDLFFARNRALQRGGAIYGNTLGTGIVDACLMQIIGPSLIFNPHDADLLNLTLTFINNSAGETGNSFFGNPIYNCIYLPESSIQHSNIMNEESKLYSEIFDFQSTVNNGIRELTSTPQRMCHCGEETDYTEELCNNTSAGEYAASVHTVPGKSFTVNLIPVDAVGTPVSSILYAEIQAKGEHDDLSFGQAQSTRRLRGLNCEAVSFTIYGTESTSALVYLYASPGGIPVTVNVSIGSCPPGFTLEPNSDGQLYCTCDDFVLNEIDTTCNESTYTISRPGDTWIGLHEQDEVAYVSSCPINYCNDDVTEVDLLIEDQLCEPGRSGTLCGECKPHLSVIFGSAKCKSCSSLWLLTVPLYAIAGILLVFVLFALNLTVTKGTIIVLIFYANIVSVNTNIFFRGTDQGFLLTFLSLLNLELGFPMCFYNGMTEIAKIGFQFVFPVYLLVLCGIIIYLSRWSSRMQKITSSSGVAILSTLIYLSYSKILRTVIDILSSATLRSSSDTHPIWLYDGNVDYFHGLHIFLAIVAIVVILVFLAPYTLSLALIVLIQRRSGRSRLKPLIDVYVASFKDRWRFWFGVRLLVLMVMCILYAALGTDNPSLAVLLQLCIIVVFAIFQAHIQPFRSFAIELLDMSFILNFTFLSLATSHIIDDSNSEEQQKTVVNLMLSLAFVVFLGIIVYHAFVQLRKIERFRDKVDDIYAMAMEKLKMDKYSPVPIKPRRAPPVAVAPTIETPVTTMELTMNGEESPGLVTATSSEPTTDSNRNTGTSDVSFDVAVPAPDGPRPHAVTFSKLREPILDYM